MSSELIFMTPIQFELRLLETDDRLPSFRTEMLFVENRVSRELKYCSTRIWFCCEKWDSFISELDALSSGKTNRASLSDMSDYFILNFVRVDESLAMQLSVSDRRHDNAETHIKLVIPIDWDVLADIHTSFRQFPVWWR